MPLQESLFSRSELPRDDGLRVSVAPSELNITEDTEIVRILPLSDLHMPAHPGATRRILGNRPYLRRMDHVVLLGDMCRCYGTDREYKTLDQFVRHLERPYSAINGNHEFYFEVLDEASPQYGHSWHEQPPEHKARQLQKFRCFFGYKSQWRAQHTLLGSFLFLGLDDIENSKPESISEQQLHFLEEQLRVAPDLPAYVFCHVPLMLETRLDMIYYDTERTACLEPPQSVCVALTERSAPIFWMSGHIHLRPDHYMFSAYLIAPGVWQVHCPDSWGYSRWMREHLVPQRHQQLFSRHLEIRRDSLTLITHDHLLRQDTARQEIDLTRG